MPGGGCLTTVRRGSERRPSSANGERHTVVADAGGSLQGDDCNPRPEAWLRFECPTVGKPQHLRLPACHRSAAGAAEHLHRYLAVERRPLVDLRRDERAQPGLWDSKFEIGRLSKADRRARPAGQECPTRWSEVVTRKSDVVIGGAAGRRAAADGGVRKLGRHDQRRVDARTSLPERGHEAAMHPGRDQASGHPGRPKASRRGCGSPRVDQKRSRRRTLNQHRPSARIGAGRQDAGWARDPPGQIRDCVELTPPALNAGRGCRDPEGVPRVRRVRSR